MDKSFEKKYTLNVAPLKEGTHRASFEVGSDFFSHFVNALVRDADVQVELSIQKYLTHLDVNIGLKGTLSLPCDRCGELYPHQLESQHRIIYSFKEGMKFEDLEVIYLNGQAPEIVLVQELYDFISLGVPIRKVPSPEVHICNPEVLAMLGLDPEGAPLELEEDESEKEIDPRWEKLKDLKKGFEE